MEMKYSLYIFESKSSNRLWISGIFKDLNDANNDYRLIPTSAEVEDKIRKIDIKEYPFI